MNSNNENDCLWRSHHGTATARVHPVHLTKRRLEVTSYAGCKHGLILWRPPISRQSKLG